MVSGMTYDTNNQEDCHYKTHPLHLTITTMFRQELAQFSIFQGLTSQQLDVLELVMEPCNLKKDKGIFEQGDSASFLYILLSGEVVVHFQPYDGPSLTVAHILPGGVFGWSAALNRDYYTSGARAVVESNAVRLTTQGLHSLCENDPETGRLILDHLAGNIAERLRNTHSQVLTILSQGIDPKDTCRRRSGIE